MSEDCKLIKMPNHFNQFIMQCQIECMTHVQLKDLVIRKLANGSNSIKCNLSQRTRHRQNPKTNEKKRMFAHIHRVLLQLFQTRMACEIRWQADQLIHRTHFGNDISPVIINDQCTILQSNDIIYTISHSNYFGFFFYLSQIFPQVMIFSRWNRVLNDHPSAV